MPITFVTVRFYVTRKLLIRMRTIILLALFLFSIPAFSQVWPGDIDNNGQVDNLDLLYLGYSYGSVGPRRDTSSIAWAEQNILQEWQQKFPTSDSLNYAHADCDGDGVISIRDMIAINLNFDEENQTVNPTEIPAGVEGIDPPMSFDATNFTDPILQGSVLSVPLSLGTSGLPIDRFNGLAFTISYDASAIDAQSIHLFTGSSWINTSGGELLQIQKNNRAEGKLDIALSRFGVNAIDGDGTIGSLYFIIEDDVIDFLPTDSLCINVTIEDIVLVDENFEQTPVVNDSLKLKIVSPNYFTTSVPKIIKDERVSVYPNPASQLLMVHSMHRMMEEISLYDALGQQIYFDKIDRRGLVEIPLIHYPPGLYLLKLLTPNGIISRKILIERK